MMDAILQNKQQKAKKYAMEPERFKINSIEIIMNSNHGTRLITYADGNWNCCCPYFTEKGTCSHIMAAIEILTEKANLTIFKKED